MGNSRFFIEDSSNLNEMLSIKKLLETNINHNKFAGLLLDNSIPGCLSQTFINNSIREKFLEKVSGGLFHNKDGFGVDFILKHESVGIKNIELKISKKKLFKNSNTCKIHLRGGYGDGNYTDYMYECDYFLIIQIDPYECYLVKADKNIIIERDASRGKDLYANIEKQYALKLDIPNFNPIPLKELLSTSVHRMMNDFFKNRTARESIFQHEEPKKATDTISQLLETRIEWGRLLGIMYDIRYNSGLSNKNSSVKFLKSDVDSKAFQYCSNGALTYIDSKGCDFLLENMYKIELKSPEQIVFDKNDNIKIILKNAGGKCNPANYKFECDYFLICDAYNAYVIKADASVITLHKNPNDVVTPLYMSFNKQDATQLQVQHVTRLYGNTPFSELHSKMIDKIIED